MADGLSFQIPQIRVEKDLLDVVSDECDLIDRFAILDRCGELGERNPDFRRRSEFRVFRLNRGLRRNGKGSRETEQEYRRQSHTDSAVAQARETADSGENIENRQIVSPSRKISAIGDGRMES
jgi:hypothetical protein